jgi:transposase
MKFALGACVEAEAIGLVSARRRLWTADEKRGIVEQTLSSDSSVAMIARQHGVNANQVFYWRKLYRAGQLGGNEQSEGVRFLPVSMAEDEPSSAAPDESVSSDGHVTINIEIPGYALVSVEGAVDASIIRAVIESLRR